MQRKNIKRNANRLKVNERPYYQSMQKNYNKPKVVQELTLKLF